MMTKVISKVKSLVLSRKSKSGQTLVEYALILAFISVVAIAVLKALGVQVTGVFSTINTKLAEAQKGSGT